MTNGVHISIINLYVWKDYYLDMNFVYTNINCFIH